MSPEDTIKEPARPSSTKYSTLHKSHNAAYDFATAPSLSSYGYDSERPHHVNSATTAPFGRPSSFVDRPSSSSPTRQSFMMSSPNASTSSISGGQTQPRKSLDILKQGRSVATGSPSSFLSNEDSGRVAVYPNINNAAGASVSKLSLGHDSLAESISDSLKAAEDLQQHHEDDEFDEDNDILEFRLQHHNDSGIIRQRLASEDGVPQIIRHTTRKFDSSLSPQDEDELDKKKDKIDVNSGADGYEVGTKADPEAEANVEADSKGNDERHSEHHSEKSHPHPSKFSHLAMKDSDMLGTFPRSALDNDNQNADDTDDNEGDWQEMKTVGVYDIYDDKCNLLVHDARNEESDGDEEDINHVTAAKGYTRVTRDEDAKSINSMDEETEFLFDQDELSRNPISQLKATKEMLSESERIAYVGLCRLSMISMATDLALVRVSRKTATSLSNSQGSLAMWSQQLMMKLYNHMDLTPEEQIMIEQLFHHGVRPEDLAPSLLKASKVHNPFADSHAVKASKDDSDDESDDPSSCSDSANANFNSKTSQLPTGVPTMQTPDDIKDQEMIDIDIRWTVLCDLFLVSISDSVYDARSRTLLELVGSKLGLSRLEIAQFEKRVSDSLEIEEANEQTWDEKDIMETRRKTSLKKKYAYVGLATLGGGLVIGLSAGLLAPVIGAGLAAGLTTVGITGTGTFLAGAGGAAVVTTTGAAIGARIGQNGMTKRMGHVKTFEFRPLHNNKRLNAIVTVSGWMSGKEDDVRLPFSTVDPIMGDLFSVLWEPDTLTSMGQTINILATEVLTQSIQQILGQTLLVALMASVQLPMALSKLGYLLDNPWNVSLDRAWASGLILADSLINRNLGVRPITLVGFSLGARVVFSCLLELSRRGAYGIVQDVYLFGSPVVVKKDQIALARSVVSGRFINGYSKKDWILGYLFRATSGGLGRIAGLAPIDGFDGLIENFDNTDYIEGHMGYRKAIPKLLSDLDWEVLSEEFAEIEDPDPDQHRERQRQLIHEFDEARKKMEEEESRRQKKSVLSWFRPKKKEWWEMADREAQAEREQEQGQEMPVQNSNSEVGSTSAVSTASFDSSEVVFDLDAIKKEINELEERTNQEAAASNIKAMKEALLPSSRSSESLGSSVTMTFDDAFADDSALRSGGKKQAQIWQADVVAQDKIESETGPETELVKEEHVPMDVSVKDGNKLPAEVQEIEEDRQENVTMTFFE